MKKSLWTAAACSVAAFLIVSCTNPVSGSGEQLQSNQQSARSLVDNLLYLAKAFPNTRDVQSGITSPAQYFSELPMTDAGGQPLAFDSLTDDQKKVFIQVWGDTTVHDWSSRADADPEFQVLLDNQATNIDKAVRGLEGRSISSYGEFAKTLSQISLDSQAELGRALASVKPRGIETSRSVATARQAILSNFKRGRVFVLTGGASSGSASGGSFAGHSSVMTSPDGVLKAATTTNDAVCYINFTAWGSSSPWSGASGVQPEPLAEWDNYPLPGINNTGSVTHLYDVGNQVWIWDWFNSHWEWQNCSKAQYDSVADSTVSKNGRWYNYTFLKSYGTTVQQFYCSQLSWDGWKFRTNIDIDWSSWDDVVTPTDIVGSDKVRQVIGFQN